MDLSVTVPMMQIRVMWMLVGQRLVSMPMTVRFATRIVWSVRVLMMKVMNMSMLMLDRIVLVFVLMRFR